MGNQSSRPYPGGYLNPTNGPSNANYGATYPMPEPQPYSKWKSWGLFKSGKKRKQEELETMMRYMNYTMPRVVQYPTTYIYPQGGQPGPAVYPQTLLSQSQPSSAAQQMPVIPTLLPDPNGQVSSLGNASMPFPQQQPQLSQSAPVIPNITDYDFGRDDRDRDRGRHRRYRSSETSDDDDASTYSDSYSPSESSPSTTTYERRRRRRRRRERERERERERDRDRGRYRSHRSRPHVSSTSQTSHSRHYRQSRNPLPPPPKDILATTPYRALLPELPSNRGEYWRSFPATIDPYSHSHPLRNEGTLGTYADALERQREREERDRQRRDNGGGGFFKSLRRRKRRDGETEAMLAQAASMMAQPTMPMGPMPQPMSGFGPGMPEPQPAPPDGGPDPALSSNQLPPGGFVAYPESVNQHGAMDNGAGPVRMPSPQPGGESAEGPPVIPPSIMMGAGTPGPNGFPPGFVPQSPYGQGGAPGPSAMRMPSPSQNLSGSSRLGGMLGTPYRSGQHISELVGMPSPGVNNGMSMPSPYRNPMAMPSPSNGPMSMPMPGPGGPPQQIRFYGDPNGPYFGFLLYSPHTILFEEELYPSALHLYEAMKFYHGRFDISESIRTTPSWQEVLRISYEHHDAQRADWREVAPREADDVNYQKFRQHEDLRNLLLSTGNSELIFAEHDDGYWDIGPNEEGLNELGKSLMRVRDRLMGEAGGAQPMM